MIATRNDRLETENGAARSMSLAAMTDRTGTAQKC